MHFAHGETNGSAQTRRTDRRAHRSSCREPVSEEDLERLLAWLAVRLSPKPPSASRASAREVRVAGFTRGASASHFLGVRDNFATVRLVRLGEVAVEQLGGLLLVAR